MCDFCHRHGEGKKWYGCGICRNTCPRDAIMLDDRSAVPEAASLWL
jgi:Pyruvate/2-oxoacid:ferredoxin oxidoreductase delta subunit